MVFNQGLKLKLKEELKNTSEILITANDVDGHDYHKVVKYFYKISNHHELYKTGNSFYNDYRKGLKSFAISSTGDKEAQQRVILGLASYFNHEENLTIAIISDSLEKNCFKELYEQSEFFEAQIEGCGKKLILSRYENIFDFYNLSNILKFAGRDKVTLEYEKIISAVIDNYDVLFWDTSSLDAMRSATNVYQALISRFDSLSIVVNASESRACEVDKIRTFFLDYGINLKGLIMDNRKR